MSDDGLGSCSCWGWDSQLLDSKLSISLSTAAWAGCWVSFGPSRSRKASCPLSWSVLLLGSSYYSLSDVSVIGPRSGVGVGVGMSIALVSWDE